jgi:peptide deformylase
MSVYPIVTGPEAEVLRQKAKKVKDPLDPEIRTLIADMFDSMHAADGLGLAAPQIGRLCVIEMDGERMVFINPTLTVLSKEKILFEEGCLSLPGQFFFIERSEKVTVRYQDEKGEDRKMKASGLLAVALQHEIDHLEGTLIIDRFKAQKYKSKAKNAIEASSQKRTI